MKINSYKTPLILFDVYKNKVFLLKLKLWEYLPTWNIIKHIFSELKVRLLLIWNIFYVWSSSINVKIKVYENWNIKFLPDHGLSEISVKWYWKQKCSYSCVALFEIIFSAEIFTFENPIWIVMNTK